MFHSKVNHAPTRRTDNTRGWAMDYTFYVEGQVSKRK